MAFFEVWSLNQPPEMNSGLAQGAVLPILGALQEAFGCVPLDAKPLIASAGLVEVAHGNGAGADA